MKTLYILLIACVFSSPLSAQLVNVITEIAATGPIGNLPAGYSAYRVYAILQDPDDRVNAVYGSSAPSPVHRLSIGSSEDFNALWNSTVAGTTASDNSCAVWPGVPETEFDSYVTIGLTSAVADACADCDGTQSNVTAYSNPFTIFYDSFGPALNANDELKPDLLVWDGTYLLDNQTSCNGFGQAPDNRVIIAQATVPTGTLEFCFNIIVLDGGNIDNGIAYVHDLDGDPGVFGETQETDGSDLGLCFGGVVGVSEDYVAPTGFHASVVPNPFVGSTWMRATSEISAIEVINSSGQVVLRQEGMRSSSFQLDATSWSAGVYIARVTDSVGATAFTRLVVY